MARIAITKFRPGPLRGWGWKLHLLLIISTVAYMPVQALALELRMSADSVQYGPYRADGISAELRDDGAVLHLTNAVSGAAGQAFVRNFALRCDGLDLTAEELCRKGAWELQLVHAENQWQLPVAGTLDEIQRGPEGWQAGTTVTIDSLEAHVIAEIDAEGGSVSVEWNGQPLTGLPNIATLPQQLEWVRTGAASGKLVVHFPNDGPSWCDYTFHVANLGFDSPEGRYAGESLSARASGRARLAETISIQIGGEIQSGDLLIDNFYTSFSDLAVQWDAKITKRGSLLAIDEMHMTDGASLDINAGATVNLDDPGTSLRYQLRHFEMHFPEAYERYVESIASAWTLDGLTVTGSLFWTGDADAYGFSSGVLDIQDLTVVDNKRGRFALTGLAAHILPGDQGLDSHFFWRGLLFQRINLGAGEAGIKAEQGMFSLNQPLRLNVLGGVLALEELHVRLPGAGSDSEPEIRLYATLENMEMEQLTEALGWPSFGGTISGKIPGVKLNQGVLAVEGQIEFNVFDGQILLSGLRIERPFGVLPSLAANLRAENLDLQQLTSTFSFGRISGRLSGFVDGLRMLDWKPVAFDAWFGTPDRDSGSQKISRQAVNTLTTIGGGSATAALTGPLMKFFNNFSYKRLGLGCKLQDYICEVRGLDDDESSVLIMEGAGVPKVMIRAFNRQMDWPTLVSGLTAASEGESIRIGNKP